MTLEDFLHRIALIGVGSFGVWLIGSALGVAAGYVPVAPGHMIRFMAATLVLLLPTVVYPYVDQLRDRAVTSAERLGLAQDGHRSF
jgi:hypothetical protein